MDWAQRVSATTGTPRRQRVVDVFDATLRVHSSAPIEFIDLTEELTRVLGEWRILDGQITVFSRHTTAAIKVNEAEERLLADFAEMLTRLCPPRGFYRHNELHLRKPPVAPDERPNGHSHCMHLLLPSSETIPVVNAKLMLGEWQRVFLVELDGPRRREVFVRAIGHAAVHEALLQDSVNGSAPSTNGSR